ncbi:MAG TPA: class I SAM-dependent methyltransferase [Planktothrix sp.]|jgi:2-polyprenyl-3-methyl-5-hydroxy-6-metoxy-1,4-benzoquinol methylase
MTAPAVTSPPSAKAVDAATAIAALRQGLSDENYLNLQVRRYLWILQTVQKQVPPGGRIGDIGAAPGHMSMMLKQMGYQVTAFDFAPDNDMWEQSPDGTFAASLRARDIPLKHWDVEVEDPGSVPHNVNGEFDCVIFTEVLEHVYRYPFSTVRQIANLLKPGGIFICTTPNRHSISSRLQGLLGKAVDTSLDLLRDAFPPHMRHVWLYTPKEVESVLRASNVEPIDTSVKNFYLWTTTISSHKILPYWSPRSLKQLLKPLLALYLLFFPGSGQAVCCVGKKNAGKG